MKNWGRLFWIAALALGVALASSAPSGGALHSRPASAQTPGGQVTLEWFGWSVFRLTSPGGKVIFINPFFKNPDSTLSLDDAGNADLILAADGHGDEVGSTVELAQKTGAKVYVPFELGAWLKQQGVPADQVVQGNPGGRL